MHQICVESDTKSCALYSDGREQHLLRVAWVPKGERGQVLLLLGLCSGQLPQHLSPHALARLPNSILDPPIGSFPSFLPL